MSEAKAKRPMIRWIRFYGTDQDYGIELNGEQAFLRQESIEPNRIEISYEKGLKLLEDFYSLPRIETYRGKDTDNRQTSIHYLVNIFDEMPQRYSEDWVDYVFVKDELDSFPELKEWFGRMKSTQTLANAEQADGDNQIQR